MAALQNAELLQMFGARIFVRPDDAIKRFDGQVMSIEEAMQLPAQYPHAHDCLVGLSEVVELGTEYRCFVHRGRVIAHSSYLTDDVRPAPQDVIASAEAIANAAATRLTSALLTIDVAAHHGVHRLVEIGGVNSWGLYGADVAAWIAAMEYEARQRWYDHQ